MFDFEYVIILSLSIFFFLLCSLILGMMKCFMSGPVEYV